MNNSERTNWNGLWRNREGVYSGQVIAKKDIPPHSRLIIRYNKFYDSNKPNSPRFVFCIENHRKIANTSKTAQNLLNYRKEI